MQMPDAASRQVWATGKSLPDASRLLQGVEESDIPNACFRSPLRIF